jgi:hypothetical protein
VKYPYDSAGFMGCQCVREWWEWGSGGGMSAADLGMDREWKPGNMIKDSILLHHVSIP